MQKYLGYNVPVFNCKATNFDDIKEHLEEMAISQIGIDGIIQFPDKEFLLTDNNMPIVYTDNFVISKGLYFSNEYYLEHKSEIDELVLYICQNSKGSSITIEDTCLINDQVIAAILSNSNITKVELGSKSDVYELDVSLYEKVKKSNIKNIKTYAVCKELEDNFDSIISFNAQRYLIGLDKYGYLQSVSDYYISDDLNDQEIENLKYLNKEANLILSSNNYENVFKIIERLKELGHNGKIRISIEAKNEFNNYIFSHLEEIKDMDKVEVSLSGNVHDFLTYIKYEKKLLDLIVPAMNLSNFEKYLYAYNVVKKFKKYKENAEDKNSARDIYKIFDNEYMVCVGFARLLGDLVEKLGIESYDYSVEIDVGLDKVDKNATVLPDGVKVTEDGHQRLRVHLVDSKYGIDGYYIADPTWDNDMEHDTYNYALMTHDEYVGTDRYNYVSTYGITELFFIHSLEDFYAKINFILDRRKKVTINDIVREFVMFFEKYDNVFYTYLMEHYEILKQPFFKLEKEIGQNILLDIGEQILNKTNNLVDGKTFKEGITNLYKNAYGITNEEELEKKVNEIMEYNKLRHELTFPKRYKINSDGSKEALLNENNKFDVIDDVDLSV